MADVGQCETQESGALSGSPIWVQVKNLSHSLQLFQVIYRELNQKWAGWISTSTYTGRCCQGSTYYPTV